MHQKQHQIKSFVLIALQFGMILLLLAGSSFRHFNLPTYLLLFLGVSLALWSISTMQKSKLRVFPEPDEKATLVTDGPYRLIRHPMYTSIILGSTGILTSPFSWFRLMIFLALCIVLFYKLHWEEQMLSEKFPGYAQYRKQTKRLIPFLF